MIDNTLGREGRVLLGVALFSPPFALLLADVLTRACTRTPPTNSSWQAPHAGRWLAADHLTLTGLALAPAFVFALVYLARGQRSPLALTGAGLAHLGTRHHFLDDNFPRNNVSHDARTRADYRRRHLSDG